MTDLSLMAKTSFILTGPALGGGESRGRVGSGGYEAVLWW